MHLLLQSRGICTGFTKTYGTIAISPCRHLHPRAYPTTASIADDRWRRPGRAQKEGTQPTRRPRAAQSEWSRGLEGAKLRKERAGCLI
jgi:hypothetical protein